MDKTAKKTEFDDKIMQANFSALLYLLTEQQALIGKLLQALLENGTLDGHQLEKVTDLTSGEDGLIPTYTQLYQRFAHYYLRTKKLLEDQELIGGDALASLTVPDPDEDKGDDHA